MKRSTLRHIIAACMIVLLMFGSVAYSYAISIHKTELAPSFKLEAYVNDAIVIEIPVHKIGFHTFVYVLDAGTRKEIIPVAHAPPNKLL